MIPMQKVLGAKTTHYIWHAQTDFVSTYSVR
jgi:hypothetical protein